MTEKTIKIYPKQKLALQILNDKTTREVLYGGGAGGGKSYLGCIWIAMSAIKYPGTRWFISREVNKDIRESTLLTLFEVFANKFGMSPADFRYRPIDSRIELSNKSMIILKELPFIPSDPNCDYLGSMEYTGGFIDEAQEVDKKVKETIRTRIRYKLGEYDLISKLLMTCNPAKNFLYDDFYAPWKQNRLPKDKVFIPSLVEDNPGISKEYIQALQSLDDESMKQRLLYGNWDFEETSRQLVLRSWIDNALVDNYEPSAEKKMGVDVAREGKDESVVCIWVGDTLVHMENIQVNISEFTDISGKIAEKIIAIAQQWGIGYRNISVDSPGVGGGIIDALRARQYFVNSYLGGTPIDDGGFTKYKNLRSYSYWQLRIKLQSGAIKILRTLPHLDELIRELTVHEFEVDDKVVELEEKDKIKRKIGRSPDYADAAVIGLAPGIIHKFGFAI